MKIDIKRAQVLIRKIQLQLDAAELSRGKLSAIEKDLLLGYLREMYDNVLGETVIMDEKAFFRADLPEETKIIEPKPPKPSKPKPKPKPKPKEVYEEPVVFKPTPQPNRPTVQQVVVGHEALFELEAAKDLSEKLKNAPIKDLKKAMSINEKILTINKLFGGNESFFNEVVDVLNGCKDFDAAKAYLSNQVVGSYRWTDKEVKKTARVFIQLVSRRYL